MSETYLSVNENQEADLETRRRFHPNGLPIISYKTDLVPDNSIVSENLFPNNVYGNLLQGLCRHYMLKTCPRNGWILKGACSPPSKYPVESVASHSWGMGILVSILTLEQSFKDEFPKFDAQRASEMTKFHDLAEAITGDITPAHGISADEKHELERNAMIELFKPFSDSTKSYLSDLYEEYELKSTIEAKFVKDCDRLDLLITAFLIERQGFIGYYDEFSYNAGKTGYFSNICSMIVSTLNETRQRLKDENKLYKTK